MLRDLGFSTLDITDIVPCQREQFDRRDREESAESGWHYLALDGETLLCFKLTNMRVSSVRHTTLDTYNTHSPETRRGSLSREYVERWMRRKIVEKVLSLLY